MKTTLRVNYSPESGKSVSSSTQLKSFLPSKQAWIQWQNEEIQRILLLLLANETEKYYWEKDAIYLFKNKVGIPDQDVDFQFIIGTQIKSLEYSEDLYFLPYLIFSVKETKIWSHFTNEEIQI